jgi:hypothetical protein
MLVMLPCPDCRRHVRNREVACPFGGADLRAHEILGPSPASAFLVAALALLGTIGCAKDTASDGESGATTTQHGSTTLDETSDSGMTSTTVDTDDGPDDTTASTGSFYAGPEVDFGGVPECDPYLQDCPEGEKCVPYASGGGNWDANKCVPVLGDKAAGEPCTYAGLIEATDDCGPGLYCWNVVEIDGEQLGECTEFCQGTQNDPECDPGSSCLVTANGAINLCLASCDPLLQDCWPGLGCYWTHSDFNCVVTTLDVPLGEPCGFINDCVAGATCMSADAMPECAGSSCCASFCDLSSPVCPQPGTVCLDFFPEGMYPGSSDIGVCVLPDP